MNISQLTKDELILELEKKINENNEISKNLKKTNKNLKESENFKSNFISNITNEIINPFSSILGLSKNILDTKDNDISKIKNMAKLIYSEAFDLDFQLKNIFAAAKTESGEIEPEIMNVDINELILSVLNTFKFKANEKMLSIIFNYDNNIELKNNSFFKTDSDKLKLILSNLLSNSIKYSNAASKIEIKLWIKNNKLSIIVEDNGIGIDKKNLDLIFDRFKRIDTSINSINKGHGLGLSVTKALINMLNGEIKVKSKINVGSTFHVSIPESEATNIDGIALDDNEFFFNNDNEIF
ncbi:MAG: HAMP domain-containing histidine kinase [Bacteroidetes bacterium]|nr:HAMP domain-containing histidine kinase [Bacteroidota bacterium]